MLYSIVNQGYHFFLIFNSKVIYGNCEFVIPLKELTTVKGLYANGLSWQYFLGRVDLSYQVCLFSNR